MQTSSSRRHAVIGLFFGAVFAVPALAQDLDVPLYDGRWNVKVQGVEGYRSAQLTIRDWGGTWRDTSRGGNVDKACRGKTFPVTVQRSTAKVFEFSVFGSSIAPVCSDWSVIVDAVDGKVQQGNVSPAGKLTLERR